MRFIGLDVHHDFCEIALRGRCDRQRAGGAARGTMAVGDRRTAPTREMASHTVRGLLACCDMRTLYLRNVPDEVVDRLERLAAQDATSVSAVAVRELAEASRRVENPALLGQLPDLEIDLTTIVQGLDSERAVR